MQRELIPDLFNERIPAPSITNAQPVPSLRREVPALDSEITLLKAKLELISQEQVKLQREFSENMKTHQLRLDKLVEAITRRDQMVTTHLVDHGQKIGGLGSRLAERKSVDLKIEEMLDRHNNIVKTFEVRLSQMQKLLAEKEAQFLQCLANLNEAKMEISRLKRL